MPRGQVRSLLAGHRWWVPAILLFMAGACQRSPADPCKYLDGLANCAFQLTERGKWHLAEDLYLEVRDSALAADCVLEAARAWNGLGAVAIVEARYLDAVDNLTKAEAKLSTVEGAEEVKATVGRNLTNAYFRLNWLDDALVAARQTEALYHIYEAKDEEWFRLHLQWSRILRSKGRTDEARDHVRMALDLGNSSSAIWQESAWIELEAGNFDDAERSLEKSLEVVGEKSKAQVYPDMAELRLRQMRWDEALRWIDKTEDLLTDSAENTDLHLESLLFYLRARAYRGRGELQRAKRAADSGLALLDEMRSTWNVQGREYFARRQKYYRFRLDLAADSQDPEDAWAVFEDYRAWSLLAVLSRKSEREVDPRVAKYVARRREALRKAIRARNQSEGGVDEALHEQRFLNRRQKLREALAREGSEGLPAEIGPKEAGGLLDGDTLGLVYALGSDRVYVLVLDSRQPLGMFTIDADRLPLELAVEKLVATMRPQAVKAPGPNSKGRRPDLGQVLLGPFADRLNSYDRLVVVAEGSLERLPFEALRHPLSGSLLIESHEVAYLPSFSVLGASRHRIGRRCAPPTASLLAMGDPVFGAEDNRWPAGVEDKRSADESLVFDRLPASAAEVEGLATLYSHGVMIALGHDATRKRLLEEAPNYRTVHVASHAWSDLKVPELSKIALSCVDSEGRLQEDCDVYFEDAASLKFCGQVVVLSACETAEGLTVDGEGILGLPRAFLHAGASSVVASLWPVSDEPTAQLMRAFHEGLSKGGGPAEALWEAKLNLRTGGAPPSVWAAFVLVGDWRVPKSSSTFSAPSGPIDRIN